MNHTPFLDSKSINAAYYPVYGILAVCLVCLILPIGAAKGGIALLGCVFGGLYFVVAVAKAGASKKNLDYLKANGYYERMCEEYPGHIDDYFTFTETFAFSKNRNLCLPVERVCALKPHMVNCINNSSKSKIELTVYMDDGEKYCFLLKTGALTESKKATLRSCVELFMFKNPSIVLKEN